MLLSPSLSRPRALAPALPRSLRSAALAGSEGTAEGSEAQPPAHLLQPRRLHLRHRHVVALSPALRHDGAPGVADGGAAVEGEGVVGVEADARRDDVGLLVQRRPPQQNIPVVPAREIQERARHADRIHAPRVVCGVRAVPAQNGWEPQVEAAGHAHVESLSRMRVGGRRRDAEGAGGVTGCEHVGLR
eukprot:967649-Rhodomonas_salina.1